MGINLNLALNILLAVLPALSVLLIIIKKIFPQTDPYFRKGVLTLAEVDDIIDAIILEYPNNKFLNTIDDILDKILKELAEAGYKVENEDLNKIKNHVKGKLRKENDINIRWENGKGFLELNN